MEKEFLNRTKDKFEWKNDDIPMGETTGGEEPIYPNLILEIPGVELETDFEDMEDVVQETCAPLLVEGAAAAARNANLSKTIGLHHKNRIPDVKCVSDDGSDDDSVLPKMREDSDSDDSNDEHDDDPVSGMLPLMRYDDDDNGNGDVVVLEDVLEDEDSDNGGIPAVEAE